MTIVPFLQKVNAEILNPLILLTFGVAFIFFLWGVVKFLSSDAADKSRSEAKSAILWGIVGMFIMFSVYGIINFVLSTFQVNTSDPTLNGQGGGASNFLKFK
jgi:phosphate starvation-inducible membrane PsiE